MHDAGFPLMPWLMLGLAVEVVFVAGWHIVRMAVASVRRGILNQHVFMEFGGFGGLTGAIIGFFNEDFAFNEWRTAWMTIRTRQAEATIG